MSRTPRIAAELSNGHEWRCVKVLEKSWAKLETELVTQDDTIMQHFKSGLTFTLTGVALTLTSVPYGSLELLDTVGPDARGRDGVSQRERNRTRTKLVLYL